MQTAQQNHLAPPEIDLALDRATQELNTSYLDLCERVERLTQELHLSRLLRCASYSAPHMDCAQRTLSELLVARWAAALNGLRIIGRLRRVALLTLANG